MSKLTKLISIFTIAISIFALTACGPSKEEQYNTLKQETIKLSEEVYQLYKTPNDNYVTRSHDGKYTKEDQQKKMALSIQEFKEADNKAIEKMPTIEKNVGKMKELTKDNVNLTNDYNKTIEQIKANTYKHINSRKNRWKKLGYEIPNDWKTIEPKF